MRSKTFFLMLVVYFFGFVALVKGNEVVNSTLGSIKAPPIESSFTFKVSVEGDKPATLSLWQTPGEHVEMHTFKGIVTGVKGKVKDEVIEASKPYNCLKWVITHPNDPLFRCDYYYAIKDGGLCCYLEEQTSGERKYYVTPLKLFPFPLKPGDASSSYTNFYLKLPDTGVLLAKSYESRSLTSDTIKAQVQIGDEKDIHVPIGTFKCYRVLISFTSHTGRFLTSAHTKITMERWFSPTLNYFIKEDDSIFLDALINSKGSIKKELVSFHLGT